MIDLPIKKYLIVGSAAMNCRPAKDIDVICYREDIRTECAPGDDYATQFIFKGRKVECLLADQQESFQYLLNEFGYLNTHEVPDTVLFAIKAAHIHLPGRGWEKHIMDYHILMKRLQYGGTFDSHMVKFITKLHKKSTEDRLGKQRTPKLNGVTKGDFFDDYVVKYMEHDDIHQMVAHKEKPMYSYMQHDPNLVECDKELWNKFPFIDKIHCVMEEAYVIAIERQILPTLKGDKVGLQPQEAFKWALMRICTTLCSGWFRQFAIDNYFTILNTYNKEFPKLLKL